MCFIVEELNEYPRRKEQEGMKTWVKVLIVTLVVAIPAFFLGPVLFPSPTDGPAPTSVQLPFFLILAATDAVLLGLGVSFILFGLPVIRMVSPDSKVRAWVMYISISYLMISWWPHLNLHRSNGSSLQGILYIDYGFHLPLEIASIALAYCFISLLVRRTRESTASTEEPAEPAV
jgi:hypothetical protein